MNQVLQTIADFALGKTIWVYLFIFFGKILEVTFGTLRIVLINRGERTIGAIIAFIEITLWLVIASSVLVGFRDDFIKGIVYALAFSLGNYFGSRLDELLAFGLSAVQVVLPDPQSANSILGSLREKGFGITSLDVHGRETDHCLLLMNIQRKRLPELLAWLETNCKGAVITVTDIKTQRGSYLKKATKGGQLRIGK